MTLGFPTARETFVNLFPSPENFILARKEGIHWEATSCTTTAYWWLFRDSRPSLRILCSGVVKSPNFSARGIDPSLRLLHGTLVICGFSSRCRNFSLWWSEYKYCASVFVSPLLKLHLPNLRSLFQRNVRAHVSRFSGFTVKGYNQSGMPCVWSSLFISSSLCAGPRFSVACLSWSVSIGFPRACLSLRVVTGSNNVPNFLKLFDWSVDLDVEDKMLLEYDDSLDTTRSTELSTVQVNVFSNLGQLWSFAVFHSHEYPRFEQSWWSNRIAGVLSSNCTVANRSRSWTKTGAYSFICTATRSRLVAYGVLDLLKVSIVSELNFPCSALCIEAPESITNIRSSVSLAPSKENKT